jgi:hypothetical protein
MNRVVSGNHQGVIAYTSPISYQSIESLLPEILEKKENPVFLILDSITDVRNIGAIARSAEVLGADGIILGMRGTAPINGDAIKTSAGALTRIPICRENSLANTITYLQEMGIIVSVSDFDSLGRYLSNLKYARIVTIEEHLLRGGFGSMVLESLPGINCSVTRVGIKQLSSETSGSQQSLRQQYEIDADSIFKVIKQEISAG